MKRLIVYLITAAATFYIAVLYGSTSFLMLFYAELALPVVLFLSIWPLRKQIDVGLTIPVPVAEQGQKAQVRVRLRKRGIWPAGRVAVQVASYVPMLSQPRLTWFYGHVQGGLEDDGQSEWRMEYEAGGVGNVQMEITRVWCYDLLGMVRLPLPERRWRQHSPENLLVLPKITNVPVTVSRQSRDFAGESEEYSRDKGGEDPAEIFRIRDYQPGDKLRSIHWKLSAKEGELMVCEQSLPLGCPVILYLNLYQPLENGGGGKRRRRRDQMLAQKRDAFLQIVASLSYGLVQQGCRHYVAWYDEKRQDILRRRIEKDEDVYEMLLRLGRLVVYGQERDMDELYRQKYHESPCITRLEIGMNLAVKQNGEKKQKYSSDANYLERQLQDTEWIV